MKNIFNDKYSCKAFKKSLLSRIWSVFFSAKKSSLVSIIDKRNWEPKYYKNNISNSNSKSNHFWSWSLTNLGSKMKYKFLISIFTICDESKNIHQNCIKLSNPFPNKTNPDKTKEACAVSSLKNLNVSLDEPHPPSVVWTFTNLNTIFTIPGLDTC